MPLHPTDRAIVRATQAGLPLCREPYRAVAEQLGLEPEEVMRRLRRMLEAGVIRRIGAVPNHYALGYRTNGIVGFEVDYSVAPNFFQYTGGTGNFDLFDLDSSVQTLMGNLVLAIPIGGSTGAGVQPYVAAGLGTIRTQLRSESDVFDDITSNDSGFNVGGGAHFFLGTHVGLRADVRYFRGFESIDDEDPIEDNPFFDQPFATEVFNFWRGTLGVTFRW